MAPDRAWSSPTYSSVSFGRRARGRGRRSQLRFGHRRRPRVPWGAVSAIVVLVLAGAGIGFVITHRSSGPSGASVATVRSDLARSVTTTPAGGTTGVALDAAVTVSTSTGRLTAVQVAGNGQSLAGAVDPTGTQWTSSGLLSASTTYRITAKVTDRSGTTGTARSSFTTLTPAAWVGVTIWPDSGLTVGVGQPVVLHFTQPVTDPAVRQALLTRLHLSASNPVPVGAYWFSDTELHLRPETPWPTGEHVTFSDSLDGWNAGGGNWGKGSGSVSFTIGDARVSTANLSTHQMTVTDNGKVVATYPISAGSTRYPTMNGVHLVLDRQSKVQMVSSTVGIPVDSPNGYDETVYWDVHISDSGEYVHAAPWSVSSQGVANVSHGCINLSTDNAEAFFNLSRVGDLVYVVGGPRPPATGDHGVMDWDTPWSSFTPVAVGQL